MSRPRIRTVKPEFFQDEKIVSLSIPGRYLALGLITLADDRGRQRYTPPLILGHVFPTGDVKPTAGERLLAQIVASGFAHEYTAGPFAYLWLPNFWRHQVINKPTESELPAHPDDPYVSLPVLEAIRAFRSESSGSESGNTSRSSPVVPPVGLPLSRVGAHSVPFLEEQQGVKEPGPIDARAALDSLGDGPAAERLRETVAILSTSPRIQLDPELMGVANRLLANPELDHRRAAHIVVANLTSPTYRTTDGGQALGYAFEELARSAARMPATSTDEKKATADRRRAAALSVYGEGTAA